MRRLHLLLAAATIAATGLTLTLATPASAHHNPPVVTVSEPGDCGQFTLAVAWTGDHHSNAVLQYREDGGEAIVRTDLDGLSVEFGPYDTAAAVQWRIFGGGERAYDSPPIDDLAALIAHYAPGDVPVPPHADAPGWSWHQVDVDGCEPAPSPEPTEPTEDPTSEPTQEPTAEPSGDPTTTPAATSSPTTSTVPIGLTGGGQLPATGAGFPLAAAAGLGVLALLIGGGGLLYTRRHPARRH